MWDYCVRARGVEKKILVHEGRYVWDWASCRIRTIGPPEWLAGESVCVFAFYS